MPSTAMMASSMMLRRRRKRYWRAGKSASRLLFFRCCFGKGKLPQIQHSAAENVLESRFTAETNTQKVPCLCRPSETEIVCSGKAFKGSSSFTIDPASCNVGVLLAKMSRHSKPNISFRIFGEKIGGSAQVLAPEQSRKNERKWKLVTRGYCDLQKCDPSLSLLSLGFLPGTMRLIRAVPVKYAIRPLSSLQNQPNS